ncbi:MAG: hypothetical protein AAGF66_10010 [Cyanobacteria bacterium P01_H01_bin.119]
MVNCPVPHRPVQWSVIPLAIAGLAATTLPAVVQSPAQANEFERCATALTRSGVSIEEADYACANALHPVDVSSCYTKVLDDISLESGALLYACRRVRRPLELATCVVDIHRDRLNEGSTAVLENCRRSLLPVRYSQCVVGLIDASAIELSDSLSECIAGGYRPRDISPTFIPAD